MKNGLPRNERLQSVEQREIRMHFRAILAEPGKNYKLSKIRILSYVFHFLFLCRGRRGVDVAGDFLEKMLILDRFGGCELGKFLHGLEGTAHSIALNLRDK